MKGRRGRALGRQGADLRSGGVQAGEHGVAGERPPGRAQPPPPSSRTWSFPFI